MKLKTITLTMLSYAAVYGLASCGSHGHDHGHDDDHDHDREEQPGHDHDGEDHDGDEHSQPDGDTQAQRKAGPNGGRLLTSIEPQAEFFVTDDGKVQITFLDAAGQPAPIAGQTVNVVAGDRSNLTTLTFAKQGEVLSSTSALPQGDDFPLVVALQVDSSSDLTREKFTLDLSVCQACKLRGYACICPH